MANMTEEQKKQFRALAAVALNGLLANSRYLERLENRTDYWTEEISHAACAIARRMQEEIKQFEES